MTGLEIALIASTALSAAGAISGAQAASAQAKGQAKAAEYNATLQKQQAAIQGRETSLAVEQQRREARQVGGAQRAALAETGIGFEQLGTSLIERGRTFAELDALNISSQGEQERRGLLAGSALSSYEARGYKQQARAARTAGLLNTASAVAGGVSSYKGAQARGYFK